LNDIKRMKIITFTCWIITAVVLVGVAAWVVVGMRPFERGWVTFGGWSDVHTGPMEVVGTHNVPAGGVRSMHIEWTSGAVDVRPWDGNYIRITEHSPRELRAGENLQLDTSGDTVTIEFRARGTPMHNMPAKNLEVLVPRELGGNFDRFSIDSTSGRVVIDAIGATTFTIDSISGRIEVSGASADEISLRSVSGRVEVSGAQAQRLTVTTTSGRQELFGSFGQANLSSVSGRVEFTGTTVPADLTIGSTSGRVAVTVPDEGAISVHHSSVSGRFSSEIPVILHDGNPQFSLSTVSGRVGIYSLR